MLENSTLELMFDGDIRGYRTGKDCVLELNSNPFWCGINLSAEELQAVEQESEGYLDIVDDVIEKAYLYSDGHQWRLTWIEGSIFAYRDDHTFDDCE